MSYKAIVNYFGNSRFGFHVRGLVVKETEKAPFQSGFVLARAITFDENIDKAIVERLWNLEQRFNAEMGFRWRTAGIPSIPFPENVIIKKNYKYDIENWRLTE